VRYLLVVILLCAGTGVAAEQGVAKRGGVAVPTAKTTRVMQRRRAPMRVLRRIAGAEPRFAEWLSGWGTRVNRDGAVPLRREGSHVND
jgi:hypothetical protein